MQTNLHLLLVCCAISHQGGASAVMFALKYGHVETVKSLLQEYNCKASKNAVSILSVLCTTTYHLNVIQRNHLHQHTPIESPRSLCFVHQYMSSTLSLLQLGDSLLHVVTKTRNFEIIDYLVNEHGLDVNDQNAVSISHSKTTAQRFIVMCIQTNLQVHSTVC